MMKFLNDVIRFYELNNDYVEYLHGIDSQVYYHKSYRQDIKPYVGIMVSLNGINYFIPLTSAKPRHSKQPLRTRDYLMIYDEVKKSTNESNSIYKDNPNSEHKKYHILGVLDIRKMIPVSQGNYSIIDFKSLNLNYQFLFYKEHEFCKSKQDIILSSATKIYEKTLKKGAALSKFHCDFVKLEIAMQNYS